MPQIFSLFLLKIQGKIEEEEKKR